MTQQGGSRLTDRYNGHLSGPIAPKTADPKRRNSGSKIRGQSLTCARGELNRETTTRDPAQATVLSAKAMFRCLRLPPVSSGPCTPGVHQPVFSWAIRDGELQA